MARLRIVPALTCCFILLAGCAHRPVLDGRLLLADAPLRLRVGETLPAIRSELGLCLPVGGWVPSVLSEDAAVVGVREGVDGAFDLVGRRPGRTRIRIVNALARPAPGEAAFPDAGSIEVEVGP